MSLVEAMASGLPVVVTDIPANREWVTRDSGYIVPVGNSKTLSYVLVNILEEKGRRKDYGRKNRQIAEEKGDWSKNFNGLEKIFEELVNG